MSYWFTSYPVCTSSHLRGRLARVTDSKNTNNASANHRKVGTSAPANQAAYNQVLDAAKRAVEIAIEQMKPPRSPIWQRRFERQRLQTHSATKRALAVPPRFVVL